MRRTYTAIGHKNGLPIEALSFQLGHKSIATTQLYMGQPPTYAKGLIANFTNQVLPNIPQRQQPQQPLAAG